LASLELKAGNVGAAEYAISLLPVRLSGRDLQVRDTIVAHIKLRKGMIEEARLLAGRYAKSNDPYCLYVIARIELEDGMLHLASRKFEAAKSLITNAQQIVRSARADRPENADLAELAGRIEALAKQYHW
jgi:hypothetical protein